MFNFNPPVVVLNDTDKLKPEHLSVNSMVGGGYDPFSGQNLSANINMSLTWQALHPRGLYARFVQEVTLCHRDGDSRVVQAYRQGAAERDGSVLRRPAQGAAV
jgi:hypothetical protein